MADTPKWMYKLAQSMRNTPRTWDKFTDDMKYEALSVMMDYLDGRLDEASRNKRKELITERLALGEIT